MSSFEATFKANGKEYEVLSCGYSFNQATDEKGRPSSEVRAGNISLEITAHDDKELVGWMIDPYKKIAGSIVFNNLDAASTMKEIKFEDGYCVGYSEHFNASSGESLTTSLSISARKIDVHGSVHEMKW